MHDWVELMDLISEDDISWLLNTGHDRRVESGVVLVSEGAQVNALYFIIDGVLQVVTAGCGEPLALLGPGEIVGEISFLDKFPASATVQAKEDSRVLELPRNQLSTKLQVDRAFAARFYRALALILARRLRRATSTAPRGASPEGNKVATDTAAWKALEPAIEQFKLAVAAAAATAVKGEARIPEAQEREVRRRFRGLLSLLGEWLGEHSLEVDSIRSEVGRQVQQELLPYMLLTRTAHRLYAKPRGYAGDFQTLDLIYQNQEAGSGALGALIDRLFLDDTTAQTLRARRALLAEEIRQTVEGARERKEPARVTNLSCGPATEIFDVYAALDDTSRLEATLLDFDLQALAHVSQEVERQKLASHVRLINGNVVYLALGREQLDLEPQDLVYAALLIDGYSDNVCKRVIDYGHAVLRPGGKMVLCGFHPQNDNRAFLEHVLNWSPNHRTEVDLNRLFAGSAFGRPCTNLRRDERGATLLAECVK
jgi:extracellular factor (EF) 3-hydroxypalmitic acid methyl ester biosynthesis protein